MFPDELIFVDIGEHGGTRAFQLKEDFRYISEKYGEIRVPKGFITDGVSSPRWSWSLIGPTSRSFRISVIHDYIMKKECVYNFTLSDATYIMNEGMKVLGVPWWERQIVHKGLLIGSWVYWKKS